MLRVGAPFLQWSSDLQGLGLKGLGFRVRVDE